MRIGIDLGGFKIEGVALRRDGRIAPALTWINDQPFHPDLAVALAHDVRVANDANCFTISEVTDGAAADRTAASAVQPSSGHEKGRTPSQGPGRYARFTDYDVTSRDGR